MPAWRALYHCPEGTDFSSHFVSHQILPFTQPLSSQVTLDEFLDYYSGLSASIENDEHFKLMMNIAWQMPQEEEEEEQQGEEEEKAEEGEEMFFGSFCFFWWTNIEVEWGIVYMKRFSDESEDENSDEDESDDDSSGK